ncbi:MAG: cryptochrome/photolyase family protein [Planctomycetes bacterium]|nr:cryptochrome/photolyase family protein [Planctomycetota bacterium]
MSIFLHQLRALESRARPRRWVYVPYDQLSDELGLLARTPANELGIVIVESRWKAMRRPYHRQKLALLLANQRHFALEQARRGVAVRFIATDRPFIETLREVARELGPLAVHRPAERELRVELAPLVGDGLLEELPHEGWLSSRAQFDASQPRGAPYRMDAFYRHVRVGTGILMDGEKPVGGKYSFDTENRRPWKGDPPAPEPPRFEPDAITREVITLIEEQFAAHPGKIVAEELPATRADADRMLRWAIESCLPEFGPYEDALSERSRGLFHTRLAPLVNLHRLTPRAVLDAALQADLPLASREGFVRQLLGWREFVRHVHDATDGFRRLSGRRVPSDGAIGDGGWSAWSGRAWREEVVAHDDSALGLDGGARPAVLAARAALPPVYWGKPSGMRCLDRVVADVWSTGYTHHIARLMVLSNVATLLDVEPRTLTDWFWAAFADAYDWVVEPNVLGMGTFAAGDLMTTKPYVCGAAYLNRMGDSCRACRFDPRRDCPITSLYWEFLARKQEKLAENPRLFMPLRALAKRSAAQREADARTVKHVKRRLAAGEEV